MLNLFYKFGALLAAALATSLIGSVFSSQSVIAGLQSLNIEIPMAARLSMTFSDLGILSSLFPITGVCFLIGFTVAGFCKRTLGGNRTLWMTIAGASGLMATLLILKAVFVVTAIAGTRSTLGFLSFGFAGAIGGWVYACLSTRFISNQDKIPLDNPEHQTTLSTKQ